MSQAAEPTASIEVALAHASRLLASDPALAGEQAREVLRVADNHPMALLLLAASHTARGEPDAAIGILQPLVATQPGWAAAHHEYGIALGRIGRGKDAVIALRRAVALKPDLPQAWLALGNHLTAIGDMEAASEAYTRHVQHSTRDPDLMHAAAALAENRIHDAETRLRAQLKKSPTDVAAIRMLAEVAARLGRVEDAQQLLERCLQLAPGFHAARRNYAQVLHRGNEPQRALAQVEILLRDDPGNPAYRNLKAVVLCRTGDYVPAIELYEQLLAEYPAHPALLLSYGHALKTAGQRDRAIAAYRAALALDPGFGEAWWSLANLKTLRFDDDDVRTMRAQLARPDLAAEHRLHLEFALGKALEDADAHADAFAHYARGNALRRKRLSYDAARTTMRFRRARETYDRAFFERREGWGAPASDPLFVVGLPRSGSTLIEQILSSHSLVEGTMELPEVTSITRALRRDGGVGTDGTYHDVVAKLDADAMRRLGERYLERTRIQRKTTAPFFIDKMPNNFAHIGLIRAMLPNARIIDARRHPLACGFSLFKQHFARGQNFSYSLDDIGRYYRDYVELMAHFDAVMPGRIHRVIHEALVEDTEAEMRRLLDFCGLPFEAQCLRFFENARPVRTASSEQVRRPINRDGLEQWRHYEPWLDPLKQALGPVLDAYPDVPQLHSPPA